MQTDGDHLVHHVRRPFFPLSFNWGRTDGRRKVVSQDGSHGVMAEARKPVLGPGGGQGLVVADGAICEK